MQITVSAAHAGRRHRRPADARRSRTRSASTSCGSAVNQLAQQLTTQGITGRHQPRGTQPEAADEAGEPAVDPRYAAAQAALEADDVDGAVAEYQKLVDANPADAEAAAGLAMAKVLQRTRGADLRPPVRLRPRAPTTSTRRPWSPTSTCSAATWTTRSTDSST